MAMEFVRCAECAARDCRRSTNGVNKMKHKLSCIGAIGLIAASAAMAQTGAGGATRGRSTLALLNSRVPEVAFDEVELEQVMDWIGEITGVNVVVRWETLEDNGVDRDKPISIRVRNLPLRSVLWMIMNAAGGTDIKLAYRATADLIVLSLDEDLGKDMIVKVYDVSDMLIRIPRFTNAATINVSQALNQAGRNAGRGGGRGGGGGGGGRGGQLFDDDEDEDEDENNEGGDMQKLIQVIVDTVEPDSWNVNGGTGSITPLRGQIIVRNSILVHQLLGGYMDEDQIAGR